MTPELVRKFIKLEDETDMRMRFKNIIRLHGEVGLCNAMGEMAACVQIAMDVMDEFKRLGQL